ncbi:MAG TPA: hypothetical protein VF307_05150 [Candidatus Nanopelagicaceae bacterium]
MFRPVNYFLLGFLLLVAIIYRRDPSQRAAFLAVLKDQKAMTFGVLWVIFAVATNFMSHGFHDVLNVVIQALISGFAVAAILNWFYKRKRASRS